MHKTCDTKNRKTEEQKAASAIKHKCSEIVEHDGKEQVLFSHA
jgi:hypothetical protein